MNESNEKEYVKLPDSELHVMLALWEPEEKEPGTPISAGRMMDVSEDLAKLKLTTGS